MYRSVLVPLDGSPFGEQALPLALGIARRAGASLHVVTVHVPLPALAGTGPAGLHDTVDPVLRQRSRTYLDTIVKRLTLVAEVPVSSALVEGPVGEALAEYASAWGTDLVVMTTHGRGPLSRAWLGSVADDLVRRVPMPVLLVRPQETLVDLTREPQWQQILIPLDGSPLAEQIIAPAVALGRLLQADYVLLRVIKPMVTGGDPANALVSGGFEYEVLKELRALYEEDRAQARTYLETIAERLRGQSLQVQTRVVVNDQPAVAILNEVKAYPTDLIALATHGRRGLARLVLGSVADKVVRGAHLPVLVQRPATDTF